MLIHKLVLRRRGGNNSVELSLLVLLYNTKLINKLKFNIYKKPKLKIRNSMIIQIFMNLENHPTIHSEERSTC